MREQILILKYNGKKCRTFFFINLFDIFLPWHNGLRQHSFVHLFTHSLARSLACQHIHHACIYACPSTLHTHILFFHSFYFYFTHLLLEACTHCFPRCASLIWSDNVCDQSRRNSFACSWSHSRFLSLSLSLKCGPSSPSSLSTPISLSLMHISVVL